jgi:hypothetical protein
MISGFLLTGVLGASRKEQTNQSLESRLCGLVSSAAPYYDIYCDSIHFQISDAVVRQNSLIFELSWFQEDPPRMTHTYAVNAKGTIGYARHVYDWARQGSNGQLDQADLERTEVLLQGLPEQYALPSVTRVLIVSSYRNGRWTTYCYDRRLMPSELIDLLRVIGAERYFTN